MESKEFEVRKGERKLKREAYAALKTIYKVLTELITNSDQEYKDNEKIITKDDKLIEVLIDTSSGEIFIMDNGFGLSYKEMEETFYEYGTQKKSHKEGSRNLFGQGLSDVLFSRPCGGDMICCDGKGNFSLAHFEIKKEKGEHGREISKQKIKISKEVLNEKIKRKYLITGRRGTCINFIYDLKQIPKNKEKIIEFVSKLSNFPMLRYINNNPKRKISITFLDDKKIIYKDVIKYEFMTSGEKLTDIETSFVYRDRNKKERLIKIQGDLWRHENKLTQGEVECEDREGGLLIVDDFDNVLDLTLFKYDENPYASHFYGNKIKLIGSNKIIRDELNHKKTPIAILTETRDGLDKKTIFYRELGKILNPIIEKFVKREQKKKGFDSELSEETMKKHLKAFNIFNKIYKDTIEEDLDDKGITEKEMENQVLLFSIKNANIFLGKEYGIYLYINPKKIKSGDQINLISDNESITFSPKKIIISKKNLKSKLIRKRIKISPKREGVVILKALGKNKEESECLINVKIKELLLPENGVCFSSKNFTSAPNVHNVIKIIIDPKKISLGEEILIETKDESINLDQNKIIVDKNHIINNMVGEIIVGYRGFKEVKTECILNCKNYTDSCNINITYGKKEGVFNGWHFVSEDQDFQSYYNPLNGYIEINLKNSINKRIFSDDDNEACKKIEYSNYAKVFLAQVILEEAFNKIGSDAYEKGKLKGKDKFTSLLQFKNKMKNHESLDILNSIIGLNDLDAEIVIVE